MKDNKKLKEKLGLLIERYKTPSTAPKKSVEEHFYEVEKSALGDTVREIFYRIVAHIPEEKRDSVHSEIAALYKESVGDSVFGLLKDVVSRSKFYKTQEMRDHHIFYLCPANIIESGLMEKFISIVADQVSDDEIDEIVDGIDSYRSPYKTNLPVQFLRDDIDELKKRNAETITDPETLKALNDELELVAETVITSTKDYSDSHGDQLDKVYGRPINRNMDVVNNEMLEQDGYQNIKNYFMTSPDSYYAGVRDLKEENLGNEQMIEDFKGENVRLVVPDKMKSALSNIISFMREKGMLSYNATGAESASKIYGFAQIREAHVRLEEAIKTQDVETIRAAREYYNTACANMREVFRMISEQIAPTPEMMVGNVNSFREDWIPCEFKNDLVINAYANSIYNLASSIDTNGVTLDELFENTNEAVFKMIKNAAAKAAPDVRLRKLSFSDAVFDTLTYFNECREYPYGAITRNVELLLQLSVGSKEFRQNTVGAMIMQSYDAQTLNMTRSGELVSIDGYLSNNAQGTLANMFLVNEEDRDYDKLRSFGAVTADGMKKIPPFNTMGYLENHKLDPNVISERIHSTIRALSEPRYDEDNMKINIGPEKMLLVIRGAQVAAYEYLMAHPTPDPGLDPAGLKAYKSLQTIIDNPEKAFSYVMNKKLKTEMKKVQTMKQYVKIADSNGKKLMKDARAEAREAEVTYNEMADALKQTVDLITEQIADGNDSPDLTEQLNHAISNLVDIKKEEIQRLKAKYVDGKLPKDYFEQRLQAVESGEHAKTIPFGADECPSFAEFKEKYAQELKAGELTKADVQLFYDRMVEAARLDENRFTLIAVGAHPKPTLEEDSFVIDEPEAEPEIIDDGEDKEQIVIEEAMDKNVISSSKIQNSGQPQRSASKQV